MANPKHVAGPVTLAGPTWRERVSDAARRCARLAGAGLLAITRPVALIVLMLAALCHYLGKPATTRIDADDRIRSPGHARAGVAPAEALLLWCALGNHRGVTAMMEGDYLTPEQQVGIRKLLEARYRGLYPVWNTLDEALRAAGIITD